MFTGIIQELGRVGDFKRTGNGHRLTVRSDSISQDAKVGASIAVNGACLTVIESKSNELTFEVMDESLRKTNLSRLHAGDAVNLEPSLKLGDKLGGHMMSGHVDGIGRILKISKENQSCRFQIGFPAEFRQFIVPKGSIAIDGVSLTVGEIGWNWFYVYIIPHTLNSTRLGCIGPGEEVNIELDLMAKYLQHQAIKKDAITEDFLREQGFV